MAGMTGFVHSCENAKMEINPFKKSIRESSFSPEQVSMIWDFYVVKSFASVTGLGRSLKDYGWSATSKGVHGHIELERQLAFNASVDGICSIRAKTIKDTLEAMDLSADRICIDHPRIVLMQDYSISIDENENLGFNNDEGRIKCLFRHVRNSLAHGNTFFFENGMLLMKDYSGKTCSASILIPQQSLLDWISIVDYNQSFYRLIPIEATLVQEDVNEQDSN